MAVRWSGPAPELLIPLERGGGPLTAQLQRELRRTIRDGRLTAGERLPSSRSLAVHLGVSRGLVVECYEQLVAEGYLVTAAGSGTRVAREVAEATREPPTAEAEELHPRVDVDFEYGIPDLASFPTHDWLWAMAEAARTAPNAVMGDEHGAGSPRLRSVVTAYHRRVRAGTADAGHAVIVGGFRHGLNLVFGALARRGVDLVGLENPGPLEHDVIARRAGLNPAPVRVDADGVDVDALRRSGARAVLVTPAHQCPTGVALTPRRRRELIAWAESVDGWILEDDYDAEFRYDRQPVGSLQGLAPERVVALGSVSKTLAPGMRIGWILAPPQLRDDLVRAKQLSSRGVPALDQLALAELIESGRFDRHLRRMRTVYAARRAVLVEALAERRPDLALEGLVAGCHAVLRLPDGADEAAVAEEALTASVMVKPLGAYRLPDPLDTGPHRPALVIGFGNVDETRIRHGVRVLAGIVP
ncbi:MocR-like pyridoxine biosynthesis transcription factor PdxR [Agromyces humatus]|uniref:PLP-dependent aminotransferase family protein n=1 Tax=Agromyces humatus TaxID=279573 RepID=A0ABP4XAT6_9MICO|nr:PLP-dependent aminotransferase family protein [Agromyces humatus]